MEINKIQSMGLDSTRSTTRQLEQKLTEEAEASRAENAIKAGVIAEPTETAAAGAAGGKPAGGQHKGPPPAAGGAGATQAAAQTTTAATDDAAYQTIVAKVNSGQQLTGAELQALRTQNPGLYAKAVQAQSARQDLRTQMEVDPSAATKAARAAIAELSSSRSTATQQQPDTDVLTRSALEDEYRHFAAQYDQVDIGS